jgi:tetratricopeptide (TPR) repeat protein
LLVGTSLAYVDAQVPLKALSPIREYIRRAHPPPLALSNPLRTYFQDLIELWGSKHELPSSDLCPALVGFLGNINELILEDLLSADKSTRADIGYTIITLDSFSATMLKGGSTLFQRLPRIIEETSGAGLRWKYIGRCISNTAMIRLIQNAEDVVEEGVRYFATETHTLTRYCEVCAKTTLLIAHPAVRFYRAAAIYYRQRSVHKAMEFIKLALSLAQQAGDIELQLLSMQTEFTAAQVCGDPYWGIAVSRKAWKIARFTSNYWEQRCTEREAWGACHSGNLSRALDLCAHGEELLISDGMQGSDRYSEFLDTRAEVNFQQTNYLESRRLYKQIADMTAPTRSPWFHVYSLTMIAHIDILTECEVAGILESINAAQAVYTAQGRPTACSRLNVELQLYRGDTQNARTSLIACLSKGPVPQCLAALGDPKNGMGGKFDTFHWAVVYLALERTKKRLAGTLNVLRCLADIFTAFRDEETALSLFHAALEGGTKMDVHHLRAGCMVGIGDVVLRRGDAMQAKAMWKKAHPLFLRSRRMKDAVSVQERLQRFGESVETLSVPVVILSPLIE